MTVGYADAIALAFGDSPFSVREFGIRIGSLRPAQTLSELKTRGVLARVGRGRYRMLAPQERPDLRSSEWGRVRRLLLSSGLPMRWAGRDAVAVWTGWRYTVSPSVYVREFEVEVPENSKREWVSYLKRYRISTDPRRRTGAVVRIRTRAGANFSTHRGEPVISREETLRLIRSHRGLYGEADRLVERER